MKIVLIHYTAPPIIGGVESIIGHHARLMLKTGHEVSILAGRGEKLVERIPLIHIPLADSRHPDILTAKNFLDSGIIPDNFEYLSGELEDSLAEKVAQADLVIAHNVCSLHKNLALTAAIHRLSARPDIPRLVLWHHDLAWTTPRYHNELHDGYPWDLLRTDWPGTTQVTISESRRHELAALLKVPIQRIRVIPNGVDPNLFLKLEPLTQVLVEKLGLMKMSPLILLPVRITPRKNIELAIRTLHVLRQTYPQAVLLVTGPLGPHNPANNDYFQMLTTLRANLNLNHEVIFLAEQVKEYIPDAVVSDLYRLADALLFPSREEGFGIPMLEAGLANLPVFCADIPPLRSLGDQYAAYFSPDADPIDVAQMMVTYFQNNKNLGLHRRVKREFTWEQIYREQIVPLLQM